MALLESLLGYEGRLKIGEIQVDASIEEIHGLEAEVTEHPVEEGADISDHYRKKVTPIKVTGKVSDTPIDVAYPGQTLVNSLNSVAVGSSPVKDAWGTFNRYFDNAEKITISTKLQTYPNVFLTSLQVTRDAANSQVLSFTCEAKQLRIAKSERVTALKLPKGKAKTGTSAKETGKGNKGKKPTEKSPEKSQSILVKGGKKIGFFK